MTFTIHFGSWIVPTALTLGISFAVGFVALKERNDTGLLSGIGTAVCTVIGIFTIVAMWVVWAVAAFTK